MSEKEYVFVGNAQLKTRDYIKNIESENRKLQQKIDKAIEYIKHSQSYGAMAQVMPHLKLYVNGDDLLEILGDKE